MSPSLIVTKYPALIPHRMSNHRTSMLACFVRAMCICGISLIVGCQDKVDPTGAQDYELKKGTLIDTLGEKNLETEVVRVELAGRRYDIPMRYMYSEAIEKNNQWPTAKAERTKVGALSLSVLLPDLKPYFPEDDARWKLLGHGERLEVSISNSPTLSISTWHGALRGRYLHGDEVYAARMPDAYGLIHFSEGRMGERYFPVDDSLELTISCDSDEAGDDRQEKFSPSCKVKSNYRTVMALEYYFSKKFLLQWKEIDAKLKAMFDQFENAATTKSSTQGN